MDNSLALSPPAINVIYGGAETIVIDHPGRPYAGAEAPHSGPMDPTAHQIANILVGNARGTESLEIAHEGPELSFTGPAIISVCGAPMECSKDGESFDMWKRVHVKAGQRVKVGKITGGGCRAYLAVYGGFPGVAKHLGSKSTSPALGIGGYQGRALAEGDSLSIVEELPDPLINTVQLPAWLIPAYTDSWEILAMPGPFEDYATQEEVEMIYAAEWEVLEPADRNGIRVHGPAPKFEHVSDTIADYACSLMSLSFTNKGQIITAPDSDPIGQYPSTATVIRADWSKVGQLKPGDKLRYCRVSLGEAISARKMVMAFINGIAEAVGSNQPLDSIQPLNTLSVAKSMTIEEFGGGIVDQVVDSDIHPNVLYRQGGDGQVIVDYGDARDDRGHRKRLVDLQKLLEDDSTTPKAIGNALGGKIVGHNSLNISFNPLALARADLISHLKALESKLGPSGSLSRALED